MSQIINRVIIRQYTIDFYSFNIFLYIDKLLFIKKIQIKNIKRFLDFYVYTDLLQK